MKIGTDKHGIIITIPNFIGKTFSYFDKWTDNNRFELITCYWDYNANCKNYAELYPLDKYSTIVLLIKETPIAGERIKRQLCRLDDETIEL